MRHGATAAEEGPAQGGRRSRFAGLAAAVLLALALALSVGLADAAAAARRPVSASMLIDVDTGRVLQQHNADARTYPASLTKIMTLYMVFDALKKKRLELDQRLPVSARAAGQAPSRLGLRPGETVTVRQAILALVTKSANDVAVVVAEALGGSEARFALDMTRRARQLGMSRTSFRNASGLPNSRQVTTARDMATLGLAIQRDFPREYRYFATREFAFRGDTFRNHNNLLASYDGADGIKTGFINASGFNLVASVKRDGHHLLGVVLGGRTARTRDRQMVALLDDGFDSLAAVREAKVPPPPLPARRPVLAESEPAESGSLISSAVAATLDAGDAGSAADGQAAVEEDAGTWGIQVGAFARRSQADRIVERVTERLRERFPDLAPHVEQVHRRNGKPLYRARLRGFDEDEAKRACGLLAKAKIDCIAVRPEHLLQIAAAQS